MGKRYRFRWGCGPPGQSACLFIAAVFAGLVLILCSPVWLLILLAMLAVFVFLLLCGKK